MFANQVHPLSSSAAEERGQEGGPAAASTAVVIGGGRGEAPPAEGAGARRPFTKHSANHTSRARRERKLMAAEARAVARERHVRRVSAVANAGGKQARAPTLEDEAELSPRWRKAELLLAQLEARNQQLHDEDGGARAHDDAAAKTQATPRTREPAEEYTHEQEVAMNNALHYAAAGAESPNVPRHGSRHNPLADPDASFSSAHDPQDSPLSKSATHLDLIYATHTWQPHGGPHDGPPSPLPP